MQIKKAFSVLWCVMALLPLVLPGVARTSGSSDNPEGAWNIYFDTQSIEHILLKPETILVNPELFWKTDRAYQLADNWHRNTKIDKNTKDYYNKWLSFLKEQATLPIEERKKGSAFTYLDSLTPFIKKYNTLSIAHIRKFLPENNISFDAGIFITTKTFPYAFMTSGNIVIDVLSPKFNMDSNFIFNLLTHEAFHLGYGYNRYLRNETPLEDEFIYNTQLDSLQNEGMAVYMAYKAQDFFPCPKEQDYVFLEDPAEVAKRLQWINEILKDADEKTLSKEKIREKSWDRGVTQRAYYVAGAHMARTIDEKLGRDALIKTVSDGPISFVSCYNSIADEKVKVYPFKPGTDSEPFLSFKRSVLAADQPEFIRLCAVMKDRAGSIEPSMQNKIMRLGYGQVYQKKWPWAVSLFKLNTDLFPESPNAWDCLGEAYFGSGDLNNAEVCYKQALTIEPTSTNALKMLEEIKKKRN